MFLDTKETGSAMVKSVFTAEDLNSLFVTTSSETDNTELGTLTTDESSDPPHAKLLSDTFGDFITDLGMTQDQAVDYGEVDEMMLRYTNPDTDGDGVLDMDQTDLPFTWMILWVNYAFDVDDVEGVPVDMAQLFKDGNYPPMEGVDLRFSRSAPEIIFSNVDETSKPVYRTEPEKWTLTWSDAGDLVGCPDGSRYTKSNMGGDPACGTALDFSVKDPYNDYGSMRLMTSFGENVINPPEGTLQWKIYENEDDPDDTPLETITLTNVNFPEDTTVSDGFVFPFPSFEAGGDGIINKINYKWVKYVQAERKFVDATPMDIELRVGGSSAEITWDSRASTDKYAFFNWNPAQYEFDTTGSFDLVTPEEDYFGDLIPIDELTGVSCSFISISGMWFKIYFTQDW